MIAIFFLLSVGNCDVRPDMEGLVAEIGFFVNGLDVNWTIWPEWRRWDFEEYLVTHILAPTDELSLSVTPVTTGCDLHYQLDSGLLTSLDATTDTALTPLLTGKNSLIVKTCLNYTYEFTVLVQDSEEALASIALKNLGGSIACAPAYAGAEFTYD
jgi:hypothetical protein